MQIRCVYLTLNLVPMLEAILSFNWLLQGIEKGFIYSLFLTTSFGYGGDYKTGLRHRVRASVSGSAFSSEASCILKDLAKAKDQNEVHTLHFDW